MHSPGCVPSTLARAICAQHLELSRGLWSLPLVARILPMLATLETIRLLAFACRGVNGERTAVFLALVSESATALLPLIAGFSAATIAQIGHIYFSTSLQEMLREMHSVASDIETWAQR